LKKRRKLEANKLRSAPVKSSPPAGSVIYFAVATAFARKIIVKPKLIQLTKAHRGSMVTLDNGWLLIDKKWYS